MTTDTFRPAQRHLYLALVTILVRPVTALAEDSATENASVHYQATAIEQGHGPFPARYSGVNSLSPHQEDDASFTTTLFVARRLWEGGELYIDPEVAAGRGLSDATGMAGFPNGEVTRIGKPEPTLYLARFFLRQTWGQGVERERVEGGQHQLAEGRPVSRLTMTAGKLAASDVFDNNAYSHDPRTQFMNWALMSNGAWDYPADTRGYTWGVAVEWNRAAWALRGGVFMLPKEANGEALDPRLDQAHGGVVEWERRYVLLGEAGKLRLLAFDNHAHMGSYRTTLDTPAFNMDITQSREYRSKYGLGLNVEQKVSRNIGTFARAGWNDGKTETWAFTEIDRTLSAGAVIQGEAWGRLNDQVGIAGVLNGLSRDHRDYLAAGGHGFIIGDGALNYQPEKILEAYYSSRFFKDLSIVLDYQRALNPAYNHDRGPVNIGAVRLHYEF